jgi:hypothetical protein
VVAPFIVALGDYEGSLFGHVEEQVDALVFDIEKAFGQGDPQIADGILKARIVLGLQDQKTQSPDFVIGRRQAVPQQKDTRINKS